MKFRELLNEWACLLKVLTLKREITTVRLSQPFRFEVALLLTIN